MARNNKSGLGRGLDALLGGSYEEALSTVPATAPEEKPTKTASNTERVTVAVEADELPPEARPHTAAPQPQSKQEEKQETVQISMEETIVGEDNVTIKGVSSRAARPARKPAAAPPAPKKKEEPKVSDEIDIDLIQPNPDQPRTRFKEDELEELASSIERDGLLQPILVRKMPNGSYQIIAGERRWQASKRAGLKKVPVRVKEATDDKVLELALIENIQRSDLNPIEEAYGYRRIMERQNLKQSDLATMLSKGRSTIANALRLLDLPEDAQQLLFEEKITAGHARAILSVSTEENRQKLTEKLLAEKLSVRETENLARLLENRPNPASLPKRQPAPKSFKAVAKQLKKKLDAPVKVKSVQGKNKIEIEFKDEDDLQRIFALIAED